MRLTVLLAVVCVAELCAAIRPDQQFNAFEHGQNDGKASVLASQQVRQGAERLTKRRPSHIPWSPLPLPHLRQDPEAQATMFKLHDLNADGGRPEFLFTADRILKEFSAPCGQSTATALDVTETLTMYQTIANTMNFPESADRDAIMQTVRRSATSRWRP